ncbi:MAG: TetR/AcrR family transcriptional regulator C-terminal domain-containing protein [Eubacterium sp.]
MANSNITKRALAQSLKELGATKILDKITVADITEHCGVNRQTFYYHFNDKYELLSWIYTQELFIPLTKDLSFENWGEKLIELFKYMKQQKKFFMNTIKSSNNFYAEYLEKVLVELFNKAITELDISNNLGEKEQNIYARFFAYGLTGVIVDWTLKGMKEEEAEFSHTLQNMVFNTERLGHEFYMYHKGEKSNRV